jgi:hypothetical protein
MHKLATRIIAVVFIIVAFTPFLLPVYFLVQQKMIQFSVHEALEEGSLQTITILRSDITWTRQEKELLLNGKLFDVKNFTRSGDYLTVTGLFDGKEDELNLQLKRSIQERSPVNTGVENALVSFLFQTLTTPPENNNTSTVLFNVNNYGFLKSEKLYSIYNSITSPPPKV